MCESADQDLHCFQKRIYHLLYSALIRLNMVFHARIQEFSPGLGGGGGDQARLPENGSDNVLFSPQLVKIDITIYSQLLTS